MPRRAKTGEIERRWWKRGHELLEEARVNGRRLPIIFGNAAVDSSQLFGWAVLDAVERADDGTRYSYSELTPLIGSTQELVKLANDEPIKAGYRRPYVPCWTPWFLHYQRERSGRPAPRAWVLKGNPARNDLDDMLVPHRRESWETERPPSGWSAGDFLFCWRSSPAKEVCGLARIVAVDDEGPARRRAKFEVEYLTGPLTHRATIAKLRRDPVLKSAGFLKPGPAGTVFRLTDAQAQRLADIVCGLSPACRPVIDDHLLGADSAPSLGEEAAASSDSVEYDDEAAYFDAHEGRVVLVEHRRRERDPRLAARAKALHRDRTGALKCTICNFDFALRYGAIGDGYAEVHHAVPLSTYAIEGGTTRVEDLAVVCANCHRMLHRRRPWLAMSALAGLLIATDT